MIIIERELGLNPLLEGGIVIRFFLTFIILLMPFCVNAEEYTIKLQDWTLVDFGGHLDWKNKSKYYSNIKKAIKVWNNEKKMIRKDTFKTKNDVTFSDVEFITSGVVGETSNLGSIRFVTTYMDRYSKKEQLNVCIHEIGHALGLAHRPLELDSVMYPYVSDNTILTIGDKANFKAVRKYYRGGIR